MTTPTGLILDFGGVFTRDAVTEARLRRYDARLGLPAGTLRGLLHSGEAWELASTGQISPAEYWARTGARYESALPAGFRCYREGCFGAEPIAPHMVRLARDLRRRFRLALCSNAMPDLAGVLAGRPDVRELFEVIVISCQVGLRKPNPAILQLTADRLGLPSAACLLVDDKPRNTAAALAMGMAAIVFKSPDQLAAELARRQLTASHDMEASTG
jgi:putative hydrolase of the HAD superfamily